VTVRKFFGDTPGIRVVIERVLLGPTVALVQEARPA
jgi:hypothetical protein